MLDRIIDPFQQVEPESYVNDGDFIWLSNEPLRSWGIRCVIFRAKQIRYQDHLCIAAVDQDYLVLYQRPGEHLDQVYYVTNAKDYILNRSEFYVMPKEEYSMLCLLADME